MKGFMGMAWDGTGVAYDLATWREALRVLKPGGHLLAFGGTRTYHRLACAIEDAGFEVRDQLAWVYGSGFPKSLDISKALDAHAGVQGGKGSVTEKSGSARSSMAGDFTGGEYHAYLPATDAARQWDGWGTALKPAWEPICLARKPLIGTVAANVLAHGVGGLNIDGCRVGDEVAGWGGGASALYEGGLSRERGKARPVVGRWPANIIHDGSDEVLAAFPQAGGQLAAASTSDTPRTSTVWGAMNRPDEPSARRIDTGSAARFFYCAKASKRDRNEGCEGLPPETTSDGRAVAADNAYQRGKTERANTHPTVKPTDLMAYLCRLVTPPGGLVLDPFLGSGSTGKGATREGFRFVGIEQSPEYLRIAEARVWYEVARMMAVDPAVNKR